MESWYGLLWKHNNRHRELLRAAERARRAKDLLKQEHATDHALDAAERAAGALPIQHLDGGLPRAASPGQPAASTVGGL